MGREADDGSRRAVRIAPDYAPIGRDVDRRVDRGGGHVYYYAGVRSVALGACRRVQGVEHAANVADEYDAGDDDRRRFDGGVESGLPSLLTGPRVDGVERTVPAGDVDRAVGDSW